MPIYLKTTLIALALLVSLAFGAVVSIPFLAKANPSIFQPRVATSSATTSPSYIPYGLATTTLTFDAHESGETSKVDEAILLMQFHASSTASSTLSWRYQFSRDNIDWYDENEVLNTNATTTEVTHGFHEYTWRQIATTTEQSDIGDGLATSSQSSRAVTIPTPTRYTRVIFYNQGHADYDVENGVGNLSLYAEIIPVKERY